MKLAQNNGNDKVMTPPTLAEAIVKHFNPVGVVRDPCRGDGAFYRSLNSHASVEEVDWCEIDQGRDFITASNLQWAGWTITNPPWSQLRAFLKKAMWSSDNVVFLCLTNALFYNGRQDDIAAAGFGIREIARVRQPKKPWPQTGFMLSANWLQRGWTGPCTMSKIEWKEVEDWM